jgi:peptide/nickel transport system ATP-binding protein
MVATPMTESPRPVLEIEQLVSWFDTPWGVVRAVDGVSLVVARGRSLGVVGESGSGKTQTFYSVLGLTRGLPGVIAGRAQVAGVDLLQGLEQYVTRAPDANGVETVSKSPQWQPVHEARLKTVVGREIAILFQDPRRSLIPYWTIAKHFEEVSRRDPTVAGHAPWREQAAERLSGLGFPQPRRVLESFPERLSGGEAQRAMLAITMAMGPSVLIADEPTTGLDTINQAIALRSIAQQHREQRMALVLISHDLGVVDAMVEDVIVMYAGRIVARAPAPVLREIADDRLHPYALALRVSRDRRARNATINVNDGSALATRATTGCAFRHRCQLRPLLPAAVQAECERAAPPLRAVEPGYEAACWGLDS